MKLFLNLIFAVSLFTAHAQEKTFVREYTYKAGELDSKLSSRAIAIDQIRSILLQELGVYVQTEQLLKTSEIGTNFSQDFIETISTVSAGITKLEILGERWDGSTYWLKAAIKIDPSSINRAIKDLIQEREKLKELKQQKEELERINKELIQLNQQAAINKKLDSVALKKEYEKEIENLNALHAIQSAGYLINNHDCKRALLEITKAIETAPNNPRLLATSAKIKFMTHDFLGAANDLKMSCALNSKNNDVCYGEFFVRLIALKDTLGAINSVSNLRVKNDLLMTYFIDGLVKTKNKDYNGAIASYSKAIELENNSLYLFTSRGISKRYLKDYYGASIDFSKAIQINPNDSIAFYNNGKVLMSLGKSNEADLAYSKAKDIREKMQPCVD